MLSQTKLGNYLFTFSLCFTLPEMILSTFRWTETIPPRYLQYDGYGRNRNKQGEDAVSYNPFSSFMVDQHCHSLLRNWNCICCDTSQTWLVFIYCMSSVYLFELSLHDESKHSKHKHQASYRLLLPDLDLDTPAPTFFAHPINTCHGTMKPADYSLSLSPHTHTQNEMLHDHSSSRNFCQPLAG